MLSYAAIVGWLSLKYDISLRNLPPFVHSTTARPLFYFRRGAISSAETIVNILVHPLENIHCTFLLGI